MGVFLVLVKVCPRPGCEKSLSKKEWKPVTPLLKYLRQKNKKEEKKHHRDHRINHQAMKQPSPIHHGLLLHLMLVSFFLQKSARKISTTNDDVPVRSSSSSAPGDSTFVVGHTFHHWLHALEHQQLLSRGAGWTRRKG